MDSVSVGASYEANAYFRSTLGLIGYVIHIRGDGTSHLSHDYGCSFIRRGGGPVVHPYLFQWLDNSATLGGQFNSTVPTQTPFWHIPV